MTRGILVAFIACLGAMFILACERPKPPVNGIAGFEVGRTRLGSVGGIPTNAGKFTRVYAGSVKLAERTASIELLFNGAQTDSVLLEILLDIPGCRPELLDKDLVGRIGKPTERADKNAFWALKYVFIAARVVGPARCEVTFVLPQDEARIARLKGSSPLSQPPSPAPPATPVEPAPAGKPASPAQPPDKPVEPAQPPGKPVESAQPPGKPVEPAPAKPVQ